MEKENSVPRLEVKNISMEFPGVKALDNASMQIVPGEVRALVGENGAGKSTLIKIISGVYQPTSGMIFLDGVKEDIADPYLALRKGIVPVHQEINLEPFLTVAENIFIGRQPLNQFGLIDYKKMNTEAVKWLSELDIQVDPNLPLGMASLAERQMVAIARAVSLDAKVLIFDEPTSSLTQKEIAGLFNVIKRLKEKDIGIIYISHRLEEVYQICESITILRDGSVVCDKKLKEIKTSEIINFMIGRDLKDMYEKTLAEIGEPVLEVRNLSVKGILNNISFTLRSGEILGVAGLVGAGRTELARALFGDLPISSGSVIIDGKEVKAKNPNGFIKSGIGLIPEDRKDLGLVTELSVGKNISMTIFKVLSRLGVINEKKENQLVENYVDRLAIKTPSIFQKVKFLSGGNQQRVVIAKWLATNPKILIVDEPTRGIDVGAKAEIHKLLNELVHQGVAVLMISSELPEITAMSDKVLVIFQGKISAELEGDKISEEEIMRFSAEMV